MFDGFHVTVTQALVPHLLRCCLVKHHLRVCCVSRRGWSFPGASLEEPEFIVSDEVCESASGSAIDEAVGFLIDLDASIEEDITADQVSMEAGAVSYSFEFEDSAALPAFHVKFDFTVSVDCR